MYKHWTGELYLWVRPWILRYKLWDGGGWLSPPTLQERWNLQGEYTYTCARVNTKCSCNWYTLNTTTVSYLTVLFFFPGSGCNIWMRVPPRFSRTSLRIVGKILWRAAVQERRPVFVLLQLVPLRLSTGLHRSQLWARRGWVFIKPL